MIIMNDCTQTLTHYKIAVVLFVLIIIFVLEILVLVSSGLHHSNNKTSEKWDDWLSTFIVTSSIHGIHYHAIQKDNDSNYSTLLSCWNVIFRSRNRKQRVANSAIGVENKNKASIFWPLIRLFVKEK
tara:strand:- start:275 stop:655 length:381 start_codon:yes stop_codon:yes gene_type:complete